MTDYISREAAFKEFIDFVRDSNNSDFVDAPTWNDAVSLIGSLPAADVVEVVHGEWVPHSIRLCLYSCSNCHCVPRDKTPYCPICGAKMEV